MDCKRSPSTTCDFQADYLIGDRSPNKTIDRSRSRIVSRARAGRREKRNCRIDMHDSVRAFVSEALARIDTRGTRVLEVGSYNENGSIRDLFKSAADYIGIDSRRGPNVDFVLDAHKIEFPQGYFRIETDRLFD